MKPRFEVKKTQGGMWYIRDNQHDTTVAHLVTHKQKESVLKMADVMVAALNAAVSRPAQGRLEGAVKSPDAQ